MELKSCPKRHIYLIGPRGSGKSLVGRALAGELGLEFRDLDAHIAAGQGQSIAALVAAQGWPAFRALEREALAGLADSPAPLVIATGGGVVLEAANCGLMRESGLVIYLEAGLETLLGRVLAQAAEADHRPALTELDPAEEMARIVKARLPVYLSTAHFRVNAEGRVADIVAAIIRTAGKAHE